MALDLSRAALVVVDVQNDFCPGGALAVPDGDAVVAVANRLMPLFPVRVLTQDWHPPSHASFASRHDGKTAFETADFPYGQQVLWPDHCIAGTPGADFHPDLQVDGAHLVIRKGHHPGIDSYSAFFENDRTTPTGLAGYLADRGVTHAVFLGLATDFCVGWSAIDARAVGLAATVVTDGCRAIDLDGSLAAAMADMDEAGVAFVASDTLTETPVR